MWVDVSEADLDAMCAKGWTIVDRGFKRYFVSPDGTRSLMDVQLPATYRPGYLYILHAGDSSRYKVGIAKNPQKRQRNLQTGSPLELKIVCQVKIGSRDLESKVHDLLRHWHSHGEWFDLGKSAEAFNDAHPKVPVGRHAARHHQPLYGAKSRDQGFSRGPQTPSQTGSTGRTDVKEKSQRDQLVAGRERAPVYRSSCPVDSVHHAAAGRRRSVGACLANRASQSRVPG